MEQIKGLLVMDVDSTLIMEEGIDLLGEEAGVGSQVAAITERAMRAVSHAAVSSARSRIFSSSRISSTASAALQPSGLPAYVWPCMNALPSLQSA